LADCAAADATQRELARARRRSDFFIGVLQLEPMR
jgi:hypothetical protein